MTGGRNRLGNYLQNACKMKVVVTITHRKHQEVQSRRLQQVWTRQSSVGAALAPPSALRSFFKVNIPREVWEPAERGLMQQSSPPRRAAGDRFVLGLKELRSELATRYCKGTSMGKWMENRCSRCSGKTAKTRSRDPQSPLDTRVCLSLCRL